MRRDRLAPADVAQPAADPHDERAARRFVVCGRVLPGHVLEVRDEDGRVLGDRVVGRRPDRRLPVGAGALELAATLDVVHRQVQPRAGAIGSALLSLS